MARTNRKARAGTGLVLKGGRRPQLIKGRKGGWTAAKRKAFTAELAATCNVAASLRVVGMSTSSLYRLRQRSAEFRAQWAEALREGYAKLELTLLDRAMNGTVKTVIRADGSVDKTIEYPNAIALALLRMHKDSVAEAAAEHDSVEIEDVRKRIARKLAMVRKRIEQEEGSEG